MNSRSKRILKMVTASTNKDFDSENPDPCNNIQQNKQECKTLSLATEPNCLSNHSSDTDSIPDSQHNLSIFVLEDIDDDLESVTGCPSSGLPAKVVEESDSLSDSTSSSNTSDSDLESSVSDTSNSTTDAYSSDDSVIDPNYKPENRLNDASSSDAEEVTQVRRNEITSPRLGPSGIKKSSLNDNNQQDDIRGLYVPSIETQLSSVDNQLPSIDSQPPSIDTQPPSIDTQPPSIDTQPPSIDTQPPSVDTQPPSIDDQSPSVNLQPRSRKRKANPDLWKRHKSKFLRNKGMAYTSLSKSKKQFDARKMGPVCSEKCKQKCFSNFSSEQRSAIFQSYWETGCIEMQRQFIYNNLTKIVPKYRYVREGSTRNFSNSYYLPLNDERIRVCKYFFLSTLGISDKTVRTVLQKYSTPTGIPNKDNRGKHGNQANKLEACLKEGVKAHINSIPRIESHYCRARSKREFIEGNMTVAALHRHYVEKCKDEDKQFVSYQIYYNIFVNDFNISFWQPKKDQCEDCTAYTNSEDKMLLQEKYDLHLKEKSLSRAEKEKDKQKASNNYFVCVYDLQAVMPCPQGDVSSFYYISKLNLLNFTITNIATHESNCYVWHEGEGARGVNEIGSCVLMYLQCLNESVSEDFDVIFYSDNCCGQQKNKYMLSIYQYAVNNLQYLRSVTHKFLIKGHTQNEGDAVHSLIQRNIKNALKSSPIYVPDQYITLIKTAKKKGTPFVVHELSHEGFFNLKSLAIGNYTTTEDGQKVKWSDIKVIKVHRDYVNKFLYKTSYENDEFTSVSTLIKKKTMNSSPIIKKLYHQKLKVTDIKKQGILKLIEKNIIPKYYHSFYANL